MKVVFIGAGALGSALGTLLTEAGLDITLVDVPGERIELLACEGIYLTTQRRERLVRVKAVDNPAKADVADVVVICVKSFDTRQAVRDAGPVIGSNTRVLSIQNGAGNIETIAEEVGSDMVIGGSTAYSATLQDANRVVLEEGGGGWIRLGRLDGQTDAVLEEIANAFRKAGLPTEITPKVQEVIWTKLLLNASVNPVGTITGLNNAGTFANPYSREVMVMAIQEGYQVAKAMGLNILDPENLARLLLTSGDAAVARGDTNLVSMLQDMLRGRRTEIEAINGMVIKEGERLGIPTPVNRTLAMLVKALEHKNGVIR